MDTHLHSAHLLPLDLLTGSPEVSPFSPAVRPDPQALPWQSRDTQHAQLTQRITAVLRAAVGGFACDGADFYLLDDATTQLQLRAHFASPHREPGAPRRPLAKALADVAAMAGSAIVLEDDAAMVDWPVPVWCGAAVCLPVASDRTVYGTLWLYSNESRSFADAEIELAEVVAGRLAAEIEIEQLRRSQPAPAVARPLETKPAPPAQPTTTSSIRVVPRLDQWETAGWNAKICPGACHDWHSLSDGRMLLVAATSYGSHSGNRALVEAARVAFRSHASQSYDAGELLTRVNQTLCSASPGGGGLSLAVALLDEEGAHASVALAGTSGTLRWRASSCEAIPAASAPVGLSERTVYVPRRLEVLVRERLVLMATSDKLTTSASLDRLARLLRESSTDAVRAMSAKRAVRLVLDTAETSRTVVDSLALIRRY